MSRAFFPIDFATLSFVCSRLCPVFADDPALAATNYVATFNALCVPRGASCYTLPLAKNTRIAEGAGTTAQTLSGLSRDTDLTCYVQTVVGGSVMACSAGVNTATTA